MYNFYFACLIACIIHKALRIVFSTQMTQIVLITAVFLIIEKNLRKSFKSASSVCFYKKLITPLRPCLSILRRKDTTFFPPHKTFFKKK